jgi:hypothetical protein
VEPKSFTTNESPFTPNPRCRSVTSAHAWLRQS